MQDLTFTVNEAEYNLIFNLVGRLPYVDSYLLMKKLDQQAANQLAPNDDYIEAVVDAPQPTGEPS